jgi:hypothetical protein
MAKSLDIRHRNGNGASGNVRKRRSFSMSTGAKGRWRKIKAGDAFAVSFLAQVDAPERKRVYEKYIEPALGSHVSNTVTGMLKVDKITVRPLKAKAVRGTRRVRPAARKSFSGARAARTYA